MSKPSAFGKVDPFGSVTQKSECETVARNIMKILNQTGDTFRPLSWEEYETERKKDGNFSQGEKGFFERVIKFCKSEDTARLFAPDWENVD